MRTSFLIVTKQHGRHSFIYKLSKNQRFDEEGGVLSHGNLCFWMTDWLKNSKGVMQSGYWLIINIIIETRQPKHWTITKMGTIVQYMLFIYSSFAHQNCLVWRTPSKERLIKSKFCCFYIKVTLTHLMIGVRCFQFQNRTLNSFLE